MPPGILRSLAFWLLLSSIGPYISFANIINLSTNPGKISIPERSLWLSDTGNVWKQSGIEACLELKGYNQYNRNAFVYREFRGPAILQFQLATEDVAGEYILELRNTAIDKAQLLLIDDEGNQYKTRIIGDVFPFEERYIQYRTLVFPIELQAGKTYRCYLALEKSNRILSTIIELFPTPLWEQRSKHLNLIYGLFFGLFVMVIIIAFTMLLIMKHRLFLYYGLYVCFMLLLLSCFHGYSYQYLFPNNPTIQQYFMLVVQYSGMIFGNLYAFQFLGFRHHDRVINPARMVFVAIYSLGIVNSIFHQAIPPNVQSVFNIIFVTVEILNTILLAGLSIWYLIKYKSEVALVFLVSFIFVGISVFYTNLSFVVESLTYIPVGHSLFVGLAIEMIILTLYMILQYKNLENRKIRAEHQFAEEKIKSQSAFINGQELEKRKLALNLHDNIGSLLLALKQQVSAHPDPVLLEKAINKISNDVRNISHELMPSTLEQLGLVAAVRELAHKNNSLKFHIKEITPTPSINPNVAIQLYRIIQELIKNTYTHANAGNIFIQFLTENESLEITYEDDGKGFNQATILKGVGMNSIQTRTQLVNGNLSIESGVGQGMVAIIKVFL